MGNAIHEVHRDKVYALSNSYRIDGRVGSYPTDTRGYAPWNVYVIREPGTAVIIGTGMTIHETPLLEQLGTLINDERVALFPLSYEFTNLCNARPIADRFRVESVIHPEGRPEPSGWLNVRPEFAARREDGLDRATQRIYRTGDEIWVDEAGSRRLKVLFPALRLLATQWIYDKESKSLLTQDVFTWVSRPADTTPWVLQPGDQDETAIETVTSVLLGNRYWWLAGARNADVIRNRLKRLFEEYEVCNILPQNGSPLIGAEVVQRHVQLLDEAIGELAKMKPIGIEVGEWKLSPEQEEGDR